MAPARQVPTEFSRLIHSPKLVIQLNLNGLTVFWWQQLQPGNKIGVQTALDSLRDTLVQSGAGPACDVLSEQSRTNHTSQISFWSFDYA